MKILKSFTLVVALLLLAAAITWAQWSVKVYATDGVGRDSVTVGLDPAATNHIDAALGEKELPPLPPYAFDFRCVSKPRTDTCLLGVAKNWHKLVRGTQQDTFKLAFISTSAIGNKVTFSWPSGLASVGGGYWHLVNIDPLYPFNIDMTTAASFTYPNCDSVDQQYVYVVTGDGRGYRTATAHDIATASAKPGKFIKAKTYNSEARFEITSSAPVDSAFSQTLHVEFTQGIVSFLGISPSPTTAPTVDGKIAKFDIPYTGADTSKLARGNTVRLWVQGAKGKDLTIKSWWFVPSSTNPIAKKWKAVKGVGPAPTFTRQMLPMPTWDNVGTELYTEAGYPAATAPNGLILGNTTQIDTTIYNSKGIGKATTLYRYVFHPKWGDVCKTLYSKGEHTGDPACLYMLTGATKLIAKGSKSLTADKMNNVMLGSLLAFKFNLDISKWGHTSTGLGQVHYLAQPGDPSWVNDVPLDTIAKAADYYLSCKEGDYRTGITGADLVRIINSINSTFSGGSNIDTASWGGTKTILTPVRQLATLTHMLYRTSLANVAPLTGPNFIYNETEPVSYSLNQNYPNPFNPSTLISFDLSQDAIVTLKVYNLLGQEVATIADHQQFTEGSNEIEFDGSNLASGVYYYRLIVNDGDFQQVKKMMLLK